MKITAIYPLTPYPVKVLNVRFPAKADIRQLALIYCYQPKANIDFSQTPFDLHGVIIEFPPSHTFLLWLPHPLAGLQEQKLPSAYQWNVPQQLR